MIQTVKRQTSTGKKEGKSQWIVTVNQICVSSHLYPDLLRKNRYCKGFKSDLNLFQNISVCINKNDSCSCARWF